MIMKLTVVIFIASFLVFLNNEKLKTQSENKVQQSIQKTFLVTFECKSCTKRNKFSISGTESHTFSSVEFPLKKELKEGEYKMTYWQNKVQQIHLPFSVSSSSKNMIIVKE